MKGHIACRAQVWAALAHMWVHKAAIAGHGVRSLQVDEHVTERQRGRTVGERADHVLQAQRRQLKRPLVTLADGAKRGAPEGLLGENRL